jgi:hypothetical protein
MCSARPDKSCSQSPGSMLLRPDVLKSMKYFMESGAPQAKIAQMKEKFGMD